MSKHKQNDILFKSLDDLKATTNNFAIRFIKDEPARIKYNQLTHEMCLEIIAEVESGKISPLQGAENAQTARNIIMEQIRRITSDIGNANSEKIKLQGRKLDYLENKYALEDFNKPFNGLLKTEKNQVWRKIVKKAGAPNNAVNLQVRRFGRIGRSLIVFTLAVAVYNISTAEEKATAAEREVATLGGGFMGGAAGGAVAGLVCGPGAPVCSTIGVFIGGVLGAIGSDYFFGFHSN